VRKHDLYIKRPVRSASFVLVFVSDGQFSVPGRAVWPVQHLSSWVEKCFHLEGQQTVKQTINFHLIPSLKMHGALAPNSQNVCCVLLF
jgi:hypothetical protein